VIKMGEYGIDEWCWKMEEHRRKGHRIIKYPEVLVKHTKDLFEKNPNLQG